MEDQRYREAMAMGNFSNGEKEEIANENEEISAPEDGEMTITEIAEDLGVDVKTVKRKLSVLLKENPNFEPKERLTKNGSVRKHYSKEAVTRLREEKEEKEKNIPLVEKGDKSILEIRRELKISVGKIKEYIEEIREAEGRSDLKAVQKRREGVRPGWFCSEELVDKIRALKQKKDEEYEEPREGEKSVGEIADLLNMGEDKVNQYIKKILKTEGRDDLKPVLKRNKGKKKGSYCSPELIDKIKALKEERDEKINEKKRKRDELFIKNGAMTATAMAKVFPGSLPSISKYIAGLVKSDSKLDGKWITRNGVRGFYYPKKLVDIVGRISKGEVLDMAPEGWLTLEEMSRKLSKGTKWIKDHISEDEYNENTDEFLIKRVKRFHTHYSPELIERLRQMAEEEDEIHEAPEQEEMTMRAMATELDRSYKWTEREANKLLEDHPELMGQVGKKQGRRPEVFYPKQLFDKLREVSNNKPRGKGRWGKRK